MKRLLKLLLLLVAVAVVAAAGLVAYCAFRARQTEERPTKPPPEAAASPSVSNALDRIVRVLGPDADATHLDVRKTTCAELWRVLKGEFPATATLWMPGAGDWLVIRLGSGKLSLGDLMDRFAEEDCADSLGGLFASYVGELREVLPAFTDLPGEKLVQPEFFVSRAIPEIGWLDAADVDADIVKKVREEFRTGQTIRRKVLEGNLLSFGGEPQKAIDCWAQAAKRHGEDALLQERLEHLASNAEVFLKVGKFGLASKCYETMALIRPDDADALSKLAMCLDQLGRKDLAEPFRERARKLRRP